MEYAHTGIILKENCKACSGDDVCTIMNNSSLFFKSCKNYYVPSLKHIDVDIEYAYRVQLSLMIYLLTIKKNSK